MCLFAEHLAIMGRMQANANLSLKDINEHLRKIENVLRNNALNPVENNDVYMIQFLPLDTIDRIKEFKALLKGTEEAVIEFVSLFVNEFCSNCVLFRK